MIIERATPELKIYHQGPSQWSDTFEISDELGDMIVARANSLRSIVPLAIQEHLQCSFDSLGIQRNDDVTDETHYHDERGDKDLFSNSLAALVRSWGRNSRENHTAMANFEAVDDPIFGPYPLLLGLLRLVHNLAMLVVAIVPSLTKELRVFYVNWDRSIDRGTNGF
jgi:hypothetical protein